MSKIYKIIENYIDSKYRITAIETGVDSITRKDSGYYIFYTLFGKIEMSILDDDFIVHTKTCYELKDEISKVIKLKLFL